MPESVRNSNGVGQPAAGQVNTPAVSHPATGHPIIAGSIPKNVRFCVADQNGGLMGKLREAFFNYLHNLTR